MQNTSQLYKDIVAGDHWFEVSLATGQIGNLLTEDGFEIEFGGYTILLTGSDADGGYRENTLIEMNSTRALFADGKPSVGCAVAGELNVTMIRPAGEIPKMARIVPFVRACNSESKSEWIKKGVFFIDTRTTDKTVDGINTLTIHAYDDMLKSEQDYVPSINYPTSDLEAVRDVAAKMEVTLDDRTVEALGNYQLTLPVGYSCREILQYVAAANCGNFIMSDEGRLLFVALGDVVAETDYLISYGGDILVWDDTEGTTGELVRILI